MASIPQDTAPLPDTQPRQRLNNRAYEAPLNHRLDRFLESGVIAEIGTSLGLACAVYQHIVWNPVDFELLAQHPDLLFREAVMYTAYILYHRQIGRKRRRFISYVDPHDIVR